jgi:hypothetical protein
LAASSRAVKKLLEHLHGRAVDDEAVVGRLDRPRIRAEDRVVPQQVRERRVVGDVVDGDPLDVGLGRHPGAEHVAPDAAEAVDPDADWHGGSVLSFADEGRRRLSK